MLKMYALVAFIVLLGGCGCVSTVDSTTKTNSGAPVLVSENLNSNMPAVRVEFVLSRLDRDAYPEAYESFLLAMGEWAAAAPLELVVFVPQAGADTTVASIMRDRPGIILLDFIDEIRAPEGKNFLGTFSWTARKLQMDMGDFYKPEFRPDMAKAVALHELGHMFGLTHFYNAGDLEATAGSFIVPEGAETMMMSPNIPRDHSEIGISEVERKQAVKYILSVLPTKLDRF